MFQIKVERQPDGKCLIEYWQGENLTSRHELPMSNHRDRAALYNALGSAMSEFHVNVETWFSKNCPVQ